MKASIYVQDKLWDAARGRYPTLNPSELVQLALTVFVTHAQEAEDAEWRVAWGNRQSVSRVAQNGAHAAPLCGARWGFNTQCP